MTIYLVHPEVFSGSPVVIRTGRLRYSWKNLIRADPSPQKRDIVEIDGSGWENPLIIIDGSFDIDDLDTNEIRQSYLIDFAKYSTMYDGTAATTITLYAAAGLGEIQNKLLASDRTTTTLKVIIEDFSLEFDSSAEMGHIWNFSISMRETK